MLIPLRGLLVATAGLSLAACAPGGARPPTPNPAPVSVATRPLPFPVTYPLSYERALEHRTRAVTGEPGPRYWQQWTDYRLRARIDVEERQLHGEARIRYYNNSPDTLGALFLHLYQNLHAEGAPRKLPQEVTGGLTLHRVAVDGRELTAGTDRGAGYGSEATILRVVPPAPVEPGADVRLELAWSFAIPRAGASSRMGWDADNLFFLAYWYPQMAVYDDVVGWQTDWFLGGAEFYAGFGRYDLTVEAPPGWVVAASGRLLNPEEVLAPVVSERLQRAAESDEIVQIIRAEDFGRATRTSEGGYLAWRFAADTLRDVAFAVVRESLWDAARTPVGDRDGDGRIDYARVDALYRELAPRWGHSARYAQHAIAFLSKYTGYSYPWPHMTAVEGSNIIGGGMEFPMMTLIGDYNARGDSALYFVTAHELGHMWLPMIVSNDERRYAWMDEGTTTFNENQTSKDFFPGLNSEILDQLSYTRLARSGQEGEIMRRSDYHYPVDTLNGHNEALDRSPYGIASYQKPATLLATLRALLGEDTFRAAYQRFIRNWAYKHPYPWDLFNTFESVSGRELDWFWRSWYYETWTLDQALGDVTVAEGVTRIVIYDRGLVPMPVRLAVTFADGEIVRREIGVETWLAGGRRAELALRYPARPVRVEIDPDFAFPDLDRKNNVWTP